MTPTLFDGYNDVIGPPRNWDEATMGICYHLPIRLYEEDGKPYIESAWEPSDDEIRYMIDELNAGRKPKVMFRVMGTRHPVVGVWMPWSESTVGNQD